MSYDVAQPTIVTGLEHSSGAFRSREQTRRYTIDVGIRKIRICKAHACRNKLLALQICNADCKHTGKEEKTAIPF